MFSTKVRTLIQQQWAGLIALFLVLAGGTAYATHPGGTNTISSGDIINGQVRTPDLRDQEVTASKLAPNSVGAQKIVDGGVTVAEVADSAVRTDEIANRQVQAEDLAPGVAPGASGARAWGLVDSFGNLLRKKNVTAVTIAGDGIYCIDPGSGIDPTTAVMVVGEEFTDFGTDEGFNDVAHVEWDSEPSECPVGTMEVHTFLGNGTIPTGGDSDIGGFDLLEVDQDFTFVIP